MAYQQIPQNPPQPQMSQNQPPQQQPPAAQYIQRVAVPVQPQTVGVPVPVYAQPPEPRHTLPKQFTYVQNHVHPIQHHLTVVESKPKDSCLPSWWICFGLFGFIFILLLLGISTTGDCVSSDNWLFCDNHLHTHHHHDDDDHDHNNDWALLFIVVIAIGGIAACWWFSDRRRS